MRRRATLGIFGLFAATFFAFAITMTAAAYWSASGQSTGRASTGTLTAPTIVSALPNGSNVFLTWTTATAPTGAVDGYLVTKSTGGATFAACGTGLGVPKTLVTGATTCTDTNVPRGTYTYTVTAIYHSWTAASPASANVNVTGLVIAPLQSVSLAAGPMGAKLTGTTLFVRTAAAGSFQLADTVNENTYSPASVTFPTVTTTGWSHTSEKVTTGTGSAPTITYTSSPFTWSSGAATPSALTLTAADSVGFTSTATVNPVVDNSPPTGGALTVNGVGATAPGTLSSARTRFTLVRSDYTTDTGTGTNPASGVASSVLTVATAPFASAACGIFGTPTVVLGTTLPTLTSGTCYLFTLTGTDAVGNSSSVSTTVQYDSTGPTSTLVANPTSSAFVARNTIYFRNTVAGSFTLNVAATDAASGPMQATFPAITAAGWTHTAQTVTSGSGTLPTLTYSSTYSWVAGAATPPTTSIVTTDVFGNTSSTALAFAVDNTAPRGGALTVNGRAASSVGTSSYSKSTTLTPTGTNYTDAGSGLQSSTLTEQVGVLANNACTYSQPATTVTLGVALTNLTTGCYLFTLTGTDQVGNAASISTTVLVDQAPPTGGNFTINGLNAATTATALTTNQNSVTLAGQVNFADAETGLAAGSNTITRSTASLTNNTCGTFGGAGNAGTTGLATNCYRYTLTATDLAGNVSTTSIIVKVDLAAPTGGALTVNGLAANTTGSRISFSNTGIVTVNSATNYSDANSGIASNVITVQSAPLIANVCGTYAPVPGNPIVGSTQTYTATGCYEYSLVGTDNVGNTSTIYTVVKVDLAAPTGGVLTVNGVTASVAGTTSSSNGNFTISRTDFVDAETTATSVLTRQAATLTAGACGNFGGVTNLNGSPNQSGLATGCYKYTLTGTDSAGNAAAISTIVRLDTIAPTGGALNVNGVNATNGGSTSTTYGSAFTITRTDYTDANSGILSSTLTLSTAPLTGTTCGTFGTATVIVGAPAQLNLATGCYRYVLTGTDIAGNTASVTTTVSQGARITNVQVVNGTTTPGRVDQGDSVIITFSDQVSVSSLCSTWSGNTSNQSLSGAGQVTATLVNGGAGNDTLTARSATCTLRFGSLNLGSPNYTTANVTFGATGAATSLAWNATTHQLTLTLGAASGTGAATVAASSLTYTPAAGVVTGNNVTVGGTFATPTQQWF